MFGIYPQLLPVQFAVATTSILLHQSHNPPPILRNTDIVCACGALLQHLYTAWQHNAWLPTVLYCAVPPLYAVEKTQLLEHRDQDRLHACIHAVLTVATVALVSPPPSW